MKHRLLSLIVLIALALVSVVPLAAQDAPEGFPVTVVDAEGEELTFEEPPQRIICLELKCIHALKVLGLEPIAIGPEFVQSGAADPALFGNDALSIPVLPYVNGFDLEAIAALEPDIVLGWQGIEEELPREFMADIAPVYDMRDMLTQPDISAMLLEIRDLGRIFGREAEAESIATDLENRFEAYIRLAPDNRSSVATIRLDDPETGRIWVAPGCETIIGQFADCAYSGTDWLPTTAEGVLSIDADVLLVEDYVNDPGTFTPEEYAEVALWSDIRAVQNGSVYVLTPQEATAFSPIALRGMLDAIPSILYPDIVPAPLTDEQVTEILAGESAASAYTITDVNGNTLTFDEPPARFVSVGNRDIEMLAALGIVPAAVAELDYLIEMVNNPVYFPQPTEFEVLPLDEETYEPDLEALLAFAPDLVFGGDELRIAADGLDLNVYAFYANNGPSDWRDGIEELRKLAMLTEREEQAEAVIAQFEDRLAAYKALAPLDRSVMLVGAASATEFYISTEVSGRCGIIREVATCPWPDPTGGESWSYVTSLEGILELNPDVIILDNWGEWTDGEMNAVLAESALWNELTAVQAGRVTPILESYNYVQGVGPIGNMRWLDLYMPVIYPEVFPTPLTDEQVADILAEGQ